MKKLSIIAISCFLTLCLLTSCGNSDNTTGGTSNSDYDTAQKAYNLLIEAEEICIKGMDDIYGAWYFGIYDADDCTSSTVFGKLALETSFSESELKRDGGYAGSYLVNGIGTISEWQFCLETVQNCLKARGDFDKVDSLLSESKSNIQSLSSEYEFSKDFKDYYAKVASYAEFFKSPTGSFNQLQGTISDYENNIRTAKETFKFDFE